MNEKRKLNLNLFNSREMILVVMVILIALIIGASFIVLSSSYSPLIVLVGSIAIISLFVWLKKPVWALYFTLIVILLPQSLIPAQVNSYINRIATVIALAVWIIDVIRRRSRILVPSSTLLMIGFIVWATLTLLWADNFSEGVTILQRYVLRLMLFMVLIVNEIRTKRDLDGLMITLAISGVLLVVVSGVTIILQGYSPGTRLQVLEVNENGLGISLLIALTGVLWWTIRSKKNSSQLKKWLAFIFLLVSIGLIGLSGSRGSAVSLGITFLAFLIWKPTRPWGILGFLIVGFVIIAAPIVFSTTIMRFLGETGETTLGGREILWNSGWQLIKDNLMLGVGIGNSPYQVIPYLANAGIISNRLLSLVEASLHNPVLVIWAETGFPGLLLYMSVLAIALMTFIRQYLKSRKIREQYLMPYYAIVGSIFIGYSASWIKAGGIESDFSYFLMLSLLLIPSQIKIDSS